MDRTSLGRVDFWIAGWGVVIFALACWLADRAFWLGTLVGALLALANWMVLRWAGVRIAALGDAPRFWMFLALKAVLMLGAVLAALVLLPVSPLGLLVGLFALVAGILSSSVVGGIVAGDRVLKEGR